MNSSNSSALKESYSSTTNGHSVSSYRSQEDDMSPIYDPAVYMKLKGHPANVVVECAACPKRFPACEGIAFSAQVKSGDIIMAAFCCQICYLNAYPREQMWRA
jgi:hypothetical protein